MPATMEPVIRLDTADQLKADVERERQRKQEEALASYCEYLTQAEHGRLGGDELLIFDDAMKVLGKTPEDLRGDLAALKRTRELNTLYKSEAAHNAETKRLTDKAKAAKQAMDTAEAERNRHRAEWSDAKAVLSSHSAITAERGRQFTMRPWLRDMEV